MKGDDEKEIYVKCGIILRCEEIVLYLVKGMLFQECNYLERILNTNEDKIMKWGGMEIIIKGFYQTLKRN